MQAGINIKPVPGEEVGPAPALIREHEKLPQRLAGIEFDEVVRQDRERYQRQITLTALAEFLQLRRGTVRRLSFRPAKRGSRRGEARYDRDEVRAELERRNPQLTDVWPGDGNRYLTPSQAAQILAAALSRGRPISIQQLAKYRHEGRGPLYLRITGKAIRYRREDLQGWANRATGPSSE